MASTMNPLERKARASFIKGFFIALLIGILIIAFLALQLFNKIIPMIIIAGIIIPS